MIQRKKKILALTTSLAMVVCLFKPEMIRAQNVCSDIQLTASQRSQFSKMQRWLDHLDAEKGSFSQTDQNGKYTTGKFALQRPDKMRFDYNGKDGIHIIGNERKIAYTDPSVGQVTFIPMDRTPLGLLFGKTYGWDSICLQKFDQGNKLLSVTLAQKKNPSQGNITLRFHQEPLQLAGWKVEDMQGNLTEIVLDRVKSVKNFSSHYFQLPKE